MSVVKPALVLKATESLFPIRYIAHSSLVRFAQYEICAAVIPGICKQLMCMSSPRETVSCGVVKVGYGIRAMQQLCSHIAPYLHGISTSS